MKKTLKIVSLLLALIFVFCACAAEEPEIIPEYSQGDGPADLGGTKVTWAFSRSRYASSDDDYVFGYIPNSVFADTAMERKKQVEKDLNCVIDADFMADSNIVRSNLNASLMAGSHVFDIVTADSSSLNVFLKSGGFTPLSSLLDVTDTEKFGSPGMLMTMCNIDDVYGVVPFAWPDLLYSYARHIFIVNEDFIAKLGETDPRDYVENNQWTWDMFEEVLPRYTFDNMGRQVYAFQSHDAYFATGMFLSNGVAMSAFEDGNITCGVYTEAGKQALERAQEIYLRTGRDYRYPDTSTSQTRNLFINGDVTMIVAFHSEVIGGTDSIPYNTDYIIGVVPFPQGPNATPGKYFSSYEQIPYVTSIPITANDAEACAKIISEMYEPFEGYETKDDIIDYMDDQVFFDRRDSAIIVNMIRNTEYIYFWEGGRSAIEQCTSSSNPVSSIVEGLENNYDKLIAEYITPQLQGRMAIYGLD